jgi:hypothetical protein
MVIFVSTYENKHLKYYIILFLKHFRPRETLHENKHFPDCFSPKMIYYFHCKTKLIEDNCYYLYINFNYHLQENSLDLSSLESAPKSLLF